MKPNCSGCPVWKKQSSCPNRDTACVEHPNAREYLMQDVIKELERLEDSDLMVSTFERGAYRHALALIRDGVK